MSQALTLTEAAERLAPVFVEENSSSPLPVPAKPQGKWMSLENAAAVLAERVTGQQPVAKKKPAEITIKQAAKQIERPETPAELSELRARRLIATAASAQCWLELEGFINQALQHYQGRDEQALLADPQYHEVYAYGQQLRTRYEAAAQEANHAWNRQCVAENEVFETERPDWSPEDARKVGALLNRLGVSEQEMWSLWLTPEPINVASPICMALAELAVGKENTDPIHAALRAVGFDDADIDAVMSGEMPIYLRDYRIQELVARAADADTPAENRRAA